MKNIPEWAIPMIEQYKAHREAERKQNEAALQAQIAATDLAIQGIFRQIFDRMEACGVAWEYETDPYVHALAQQGYSDDMPKALLALANTVIEVSAAWGIAPVRYALAFNHARVDMRAWLDARHYVEFSYYYWPQTGYKHPSAYATLIKAGRDQSEEIYTGIQADPLSELVQPAMRIKFFAAVARMMGQNED